jgi:hypothetical protein
MKLNTSLFFGLLGSITLVASSGVSLHTTLQNNIIATSRSQASAIDIATLFPNTDMGNYDSNATPKNNEIIQFLYEQVKGTANEHVINDLNIGTSSGTTTVTTPVTVKPESSEYTGTINVTYTVKAKITLASFFNNLTIYNLENFGTKPSTFREFMIKLKTLPAFQSDDFNINQITNVDPYPVNVDAQNVYNVKIKPISTSSLYSDTNYQVTLKFSGATLAFHNLFNGSIANAGAFVNANKINET